MYNRLIICLLCALSVSLALNAQNLKLLKDFSPIYPDGSPADFTRFKLEYLFTAYDTTDGRTIWHSGGTDISTNSVGRVLPPNFGNEYKIYYGNSLYAWYLAYNPQLPYGLLCHTDGYTSIIIDTLEPSPVQAVYDAWAFSDDHLILARKDNINSDVYTFYWSGNTENSLVATGLVEKVYGNIIRYKDKLYYLRNRVNPVNNANIQDLIESNGTPNGTVVFQEHIAEQSFAQLNSVFLTLIDGKFAYFDTYSPPLGQPGFQTNLQVEGYNKISLPQGFSFGTGFALVNDKILFEYGENPADLSAPLSLFAFDGNNSEKIMTYPAVGFPYSATFYGFGGRHYFREYTAPNAGHRLWETDGTASGTKLLFDTYLLPGLPDSSDLGNLFVRPDGIVFFDVFKRPAPKQNQFYAYIIADSTLIHLFDFNSSADPYGTQLAWHRLPSNILLIAADDGQIGRELWTFDLNAVNLVHTQTPAPNIAAVRMYPNPAHSVVMTELTLDRPAKLLLYDTYGRLVLQNTIQLPENQSINVGDLMPGLYFFNLISQEGQVLGTGKLMKE